MQVWSVHECRSKVLKWEKRKSEKAKKRKREVRPCSSGSVWYRAFVRRFVCPEKVLVNASECCALACRCIVLPTMLCVYRLGLSNDRSAGTRRDSLKTFRRKYSKRSRHRQQRLPLFSDNIALATEGKSRSTPSDWQIYIVEIVIPLRYSITVKRNGKNRPASALWSAKFM